VNPEQATYILDSYALLAYLGDETGRERVEELLEGAREGHRTVLLCMINFGEVLYITERRRGLMMAQRVQGLVESLPVQLVDASRNLVLEAAHIKAGNPLSYADAFVVALAIREGATILTGDPEFRSVVDVTSIEWLA
jgi:ribonuclease VapC